MITQIGSEFDGLIRVPADEPFAYAKAQVNATRLYGLVSIDQVGWDGEHLVYEIEEDCE